MARKLREADARRTHDPSGSAYLYGELATKLDSVGFSGHARVLRSKQLDALKEGAFTDRAAELAGHLAAVGLHHGETDGPRLLGRELEQLAHPAPNSSTDSLRSTALHAQLIHAAVESAQHPLGKAAPLLAALRDTAGSTATPRYQPLLVLLLAETLLADAPELIADLDDLVVGAIAQVDEKPIEGVANDVVLRLRLVRAEYDDAERRTLLQAARRHSITKQHAALVSAREARRRALDGLARTRTLYALTVSATPDSVQLNNLSRATIRVL